MDILDFIEDKELSNILKNNVTIGNIFLDTWKESVPEATSNKGLYLDLSTGSTMEPFYFTLNTNDMTIEKSFSPNAYSLNLPFCNVGIGDSANPYEENRIAWDIYTTAFVKIFNQKIKNKLSMDT